MDGGREKTDSLKRLENSRFFVEVGIEYLELTTTLSGESVVIVFPGGMLIMNHRI